MNTYKTRGVCSREIRFEIEDNKIKTVQFIGGCSGRVGNKVIFNGNLKAHPDFQRILSFIKSRGLDCVWFPEYELTDIGSIITCEE